MLTPSENLPTLRIKCTRRRIKQVQRLLSSLQRPLQRLMALQTKITPLIPEEQPMEAPEQLHLTQHASRSLKAVKTIHSSSTCHYDLERIKLRGTFKHIHKIKLSKVSNSHKARICLEFQMDPVSVRQLRMRGKQLSSTRHAEMLTVLSLLTTRSIQALAIKAEPQQTLIRIKGRNQHNRVFS